MKRAELFQAFDQAGVTVVGAEWHDDWAVEELWKAWQSQGAPRNAVAIVQRDPGGEKLQYLIETTAKEAPEVLAEEKPEPVFLE